MPKIATICRIPIPGAGLDVSRVGHMQVTRQNHFSQTYHGDLVERSVAGSLAQDVAWSKLVSHPVGKDLDAFVYDIADNVTNGFVWKHVAPVPRECDTPKPKSINQEADDFDTQEPKVSRQMTRGLASVKTTIRPSDPFKSSTTPGSPTSIWVNSSYEEQGMSPLGSEPSDLDRRPNSENSMREMQCSSLNMTPAQSSSPTAIQGQSSAATVIPSHSTSSPRLSYNSNAASGRLAVYKSRTPGPGAKVNPKTESMLHPVRGDRVHRSMSLGRGFREEGRVERPRTAGEVAASHACLEVANCSNTGAPNSAIKSSNTSTVTAISNYGNSSFDIVPYPHSKAGTYELPEELPEQREDIPEEPPTVWIEVTIKCVTDEEEGMCSLMIIQDDVSERENAQLKLSNLTEAQLTIMAETYPRHIIDFFSVSNTNGAPQHVGDLASSHQDVTIMFMDIVGFTAMCKEVQAQVVLTFLNQLFTPFDHMCDTHDVQKVETAGDCYIVAAGIIEKELETGFCNILEEHDPVHSATKVLAFAKNMLSHSKTVVMPHNQQPVNPGPSSSLLPSSSSIPLSHIFYVVIPQVVMPHNQQPVVIRIGLHTGPCVSGLIGTKLPKFSIFGDTMNTASRLLVAGGNDDPWESTPGVEIKGKGLMNTFILEPKDLDLDDQNICKLLSSTGTGPPLGPPFVGPPLGPPLRPFPWALPS
eukprot:gene4250-14363_t